MFSPIVVNSFQTVKCTEHPSSIPLAKFHGHVIQLFSPLPAEGKLQEIIKRVLLAVISPFAYLVLAAIAFLGYFYTKEAVKQIPIEANNAVAGANKAFNPADRSELIVEQAKQEMLQTIGQILNKANVSKIKYVLSCEQSGEKQSFEIDISSQDDSMNISSVRRSIAQSMGAVEKWLIEKMETHGVEGQINIAGHAFGLSEDNVLISSWNATDTSTKDGIAFRTSQSSSTPDKQHAMEYLRLYFDTYMHMPFPEQVQAPADLFQNPLVSNLPQP